MTEERLKEIKDMIDSDYDFCRKFGIDFAIPEKELELYNEVIRLKEENKDNEQLIETQLRGLEKQKQIIDKAIEYIEKKVICFKQGNLLCELNVDDLLNILKGENK